MCVRDLGTPTMQNMANEMDTGLMQRFAEIRVGFGVRGLGLGF